MSVREDMVLAGMRSHVVPRAGSLAMCAAAIAMCAVTGALTASGSSSDNAWLEVIARVLTVAAPIGVGIFALHRPPFERFGALLIIAGSVWFLTTLTTAGDATVYSFGRLAHWGFEPLLMYCLLAFPTGRLESRFDRALVAAAALTVLFAYASATGRSHRHVGLEPDGTGDRGPAERHTRRARRIRSTS